MSGTYILQSPGGFIPPTRRRLDFSVPQR